MLAQTIGCVRYLYNRMPDDKSKAYKYFGEKGNLAPAWCKHIPVHKSQSKCIMYHFYLNDSFMENEIKIKCIMV